MPLGFFFLSRQSQRVWPQWLTFDSCDFVKILGKTGRPAAEDLMDLHTNPPYLQCTSKNMSDRWAIL